MRARRRVVIELELEEFQANQIAADILYLLEHTKEMAAIVKTTEAPFAIESRERLETFIDQLKGILNVQS